MITDNTQIISMGHDLMRATETQIKDTTDDVITRTGIQDIGATTRAGVIAIRILGITMTTHHRNKNRDSDRYRYGRLSDIIADNTDRDRYNYRMRDVTDRSKSYYDSSRDMVRVRGDIVDINIMMGSKMNITYNRQSLDRSMQLNTCYACFAHFSVTM